MSNVEADHNEGKDEKKVYNEGPWSDYLWGEGFWGTSVPKLLSDGYFYSVNSVFGIYYLSQFILALSACNFYSDNDRFLGCDYDGYRTPVEATKALDTAIYLLAIYHIIEWLRTTLLLMISCTGANMTLFYYGTALNGIFGFVVYIWTYVVYFSEAGKACSKA